MLGARRIPVNTPPLPGRNWWPITPGYRDRVHDDLPVTRAELRAALERVAVLERLVKLLAGRIGGQS